MHGPVRRLRAHFVWSAVGGARHAPARTPGLAGTPAVVPRLSWGANELLKRAFPLYASTLQFAVVHHTAGSNAYGRAQSAAIVRGIQVYHVRGNGWNDIGYNFLVDRYGQVFEGRFGGMGRNVVGAHAEGFNTGSAGVAVIGTYDGLGITAAAQAALARVIAWRLDVAHVDPLSSFNWISGGNARFPRGVPVFLRGVVGHRDTGFTGCPGDQLYGQLGGLAQLVARTGAPKIYAPAVRGRPGGVVRFTGRLSGPEPWTVTVNDAAGVPVATGTGLGPAIDWRWDATAAASGRYGWTIAAAGARPASGSFAGNAVALRMSRPVAAPASLSPNADGVDDIATISYRLSLAATVTAKLYDAAGRELSTVFVEPKTAGEHSFVFAPDALADGTYRIVLTAVGLRGKVVTASVDVLVSRILSGFAVSRRAFSPNGDGRLDRIDLAFTLGSPARVSLRVLRDELPVATAFEGDLAPGLQRASWDGATPSGPARDGVYVAELTATVVAGSVVQRLSFAIDTTAPVLQLVTRRPLRLRVSEPVELVLTLDGARRVVRAERAGVVAVPGRPAPRRMRAVAWDAAGNTSPPLRYG